MNDFATMSMQAELRHRDRIAEARRERMALEAVQAQKPSGSSGLLAYAILFVRIVRLINRQRAHRAPVNRAAI